MRGAQQQTTDLLGRIEIVLGLPGNAHHLYARHAVDSERQNLNEAMFKELRVDADDDFEANTSHPKIQQAPKSEVVAGVLLAGSGHTGRAQAQSGAGAAITASGQSLWATAADKGRDSKTPGKLSLTGGSNVTNLAERKRFELSVSFTPHRFSRAAPSTTRTPLQAPFSIPKKKDE